MDINIIDKAKKRIKRTIKTGILQPRVRKVSDKIYEYHVIHHVNKLTFKADSLNRLRLIKDEAHYEM